MIRSLYLAVLEGMNSIDMIFKFSQKPGIRGRFEGVPDPSLDDRSVSRDENFFDIPFRSGRCPTVLNPPMDLLAEDRRRSSA